MELEPLGAESLDLRHLSWVECWIVGWAAKVVWPGWLCAFLCPVCVVHILCLPKAALPQWAWCYHEQYGLDQYTAWLYTGCRTASPPALQNFFWTMRALGLGEHATLAELEAAGHEYCRRSWQVGRLELIPSQQPEAIPLMTSVRASWWLPPEGLSPSCS